MFTRVFIEDKAAVQFFAIYTVVAFAFFCERVKQFLFDGPSSRISEDLRAPMY